MLPSFEERTYLRKEVLKRKSEEKKKLDKLHREKKRIESEKRKAYIQEEIIRIGNDLKEKIIEAIGNGKNTTYRTIDGTGWGEEQHLIADGIIKMLATPGYTFEKDKVIETIPQWDNYGDGEYRSLPDIQKSFLAIIVRWE